MQLPYFFLEEAGAAATQLELPDETARHVVQVLRMQPGQALHLTNGSGLLLTAAVVEAHKKKAVVRVVERQEVLPPARRITIAISLLKNTNRFEWFLEKATELGVAGIVPLLCERTERQQFRPDRMKGILVSALQQSRQCWLPVLHPPVKLSHFLEQPAPGGLNLIAHCAEDEKQSLAALDMHEYADCRILIGPEGDFSAAEIAQARAAGYSPVTLGETRLRTETAGVAAAVLLCLGK
ncbi:MAG TPA: RsmE family RNA methyltransferase [Lacibacter sp.]|nr:RsmE family RNA methyltransferase [Lacibacter sp.]HMO87881.1 RsmE family RNA methyltransferase [Lacibacter sp.]